MLLYKCPLDFGVLYVEPPLEYGAADYLGPWQLQQAMRWGQKRQELSIGPHPPCIKVMGNLGVLSAAVVHEVVS